MAAKGAHQRIGAAVKSAPKPCFYVQAVKALGKGKYEPFTPVRFDTFEGAKTTCEKLQVDFDDDAEPIRVYVLDSLGIPVHAGGAR